jgi:hypothetical protein
MADIIVKNHIYDFMRSPNIATSQQSINVPDKSELNTLKIDVEILKDNYDVINNNSNINIDNWNNTYNTVQSNSASWSSGGGTSNTLISFISGSTYTISVSDVGVYVRKYHDTNHFIIIPLLTPSNILIAGSSITVRNSGLSSLTLSANNISTVLNYDISYSANIIDPKNTAQILYLGDNNWDII